jgi:hypothetical protein
MPKDLILSFGLDSFYELITVSFVVKTGFEPVFNVHSNLIIASFNNALPYGEGIRS